MKSEASRTVLETTNLEKDLRINVDPSLTFSWHTEMQVTKANKILGLIRRAYEYLDGDSLTKLFTALVRPHLEFSNSAWSPKLVKDKKILKGVQCHATKLVPERQDLPYKERLSLA